ncbi:hypothetical protein MTR62_00420 [Novosphingobium sp. 1949]|uniref:Uncharacterized protein n=1 Tax=Novosphingobium organovorum TaxID=2930092 RepID=A0ABT0B8D5_9SPHN|nr:hypothetical protein [Novosphingobium organovorum]MCJ2181179.1 hypothetical protein [Novosphingobium organovorum]
MHADLVAAPADRTAPTGSTPLGAHPAPGLRPTRTQRGPWLQLLTQVLHLAGPRAEFLRHAERPWASATFSGTRHTIALAFTGAAAQDDGEQFVEALPEHDFTIPGHLVADAALRGLDQDNTGEPRMELEIEVLLLDDL